ncbi:futalosine hydrolase [Streptomyces sp. SCSIO 30461]|uniref:futalosine hydrolase n=1 Tax=Streptomyces sp. SCSIO 30461 TaxID=3118085 RepID=UPI0030D0B78D
MRVLVVTAVQVEAESVAAGLSSATAAPIAPGGGARQGGEGPTAGSVVHGLSAHGLRVDGLDVDVLVAGVGPAAAAAATAKALTATSLMSGAYPNGAYDLVISAGIGGGFAPTAPIGALVVADSIVAADLGAETPDGYLGVEALGFGRSTHAPSPLSAQLADALDAVHGPVLTVSTVTGTAARAAELTVRHPRAAAEAMEGFGVAEAAAAHGIPVLEIRAVSNAVGPRDRAAWRIGDALDVLRLAFAGLGPALGPAAGSGPKAGPRPVIEEEAR